MSIEDFKKQKEELELEFKQRNRALLFQYARELPIKTGDIVEDHIGLARVEHLENTRLANNGTPDVVYYCTNLTKKKVQNKKEPFRVVWYSNIKNIFI